MEPCTGNGESHEISQPSVHLPDDDITVFASVGIIAVMLWAEGQDRVISPVLL